MQDVCLTSGDIKEIAAFSDDEIVVRYDFALPHDKGPYREGTYKFKYNSYQVEIQIASIKSESSDPLIQTIRDSAPSPGAVPELGELPYEAYSDYKSAYPYTLARIVIYPFRPSCLNLDTNGNPLMDYERSSIAGPPINEEKILALRILKFLFSSVIYQGTPSAAAIYDDVTYFHEFIFHRHRHVGIVRIHAFTSKDAYRNAYKHYVLGSEATAFAACLEELPDETISDHASLQSVILHVIDNVIRFWIEDRRLTAPFWDARRKVNSTTTPARPKKEPDIQPTLYFLLDESLKKYGVHVCREPHVGPGELDYICSYTDKKNNRLAVPVEFKLAHHNSFLDGLSKQLPQYMKAIPTKHGIFLGLWFKDEKNMHFDKPASYDIAELKKAVRTEADTINSSDNLHILHRIIDASIRPTASR